MLKKINGNIFWVNPNEWVNPITDETYDYWMILWKSDKTGATFLNTLIDTGLTIGYPVNLEDSLVLSQTVCQNKFGKWKTAFQEAFFTYNAGLNEDNKSIQGSQHSANDLAGNYLYYGDKHHNTIINFFPKMKGVKIQITIKNVAYPEKDGSASDHSQPGITYKVKLMLNAQLKEKKGMVLYLNFMFSHIYSGSDFLTSSKYIDFEEFLCQIGITGYTSLWGIHTHWVCQVGGKGGSFNPLGKKYNEFNPLIYNYDKFMELLDYRYCPKDKCDKRHSKSNGYDIQTYFSVDGGHWAHAAQIKPGIHKYRVVVDSQNKEYQIDKIIMERNPYGLISLEFNWNKPNTWMKWFLSKFSIKPTINLLEFAQNIKPFSTIHSYAYVDKNNDRLTTPESPNHVSERAYLKGVEFEVESRLPDKDEDYGQYTFIPYVTRTLSSGKNVLLRGSRLLLWFVK